MEASLKQMRDAMFVPCQTREEFSNWIKYYLGFYLPDSIVDESSNTSPLDILWDVYCVCIKGGNVDFNRVLGLSSRDSFKTLGASILEVLALLHLGRSVAHMASIEPQAKKAQKYVRDFFAKPHLRDFVTTQNERRVEITRYSYEGSYLTLSEWEVLPVIEKAKYERKENYLQIVICTIQGANCVDGNLHVKTKDRGFVKVIDVLPGELIEGHNLRTMADDWMVAGSVSYTTKPAMAVTVDGVTFEMSEDHMSYGDRGWQMARNCIVGHNLFGNPLDDFFPVPDRLPIGSNRIDNPYSVILGTLLGDASITWPKNKDGVKYGQFPRMAVTHEDSQRQLNEAVERAWNILGIENRRYLDAGGFTKQGWTKNPSCKSYTKTHIIIKEFYDLFIKDGKKTITKEVANAIDAEALAYWIMDDGCANRVTVGSSKPHAITIPVCSFSLDEIAILQEALKEKFGFESFVTWTSKINGYPLLQFDINTSRKISRLADPYILPTLKYKFPSYSRASFCGICGKLGEWTKLSRRKSYSCSKECKAVRNLKYGRTSAVHKLAGCVLELQKLEFVGDRLLYDLHVDTEDNLCRNFYVYVGKCRLLLHNSEHVPFFCVDECDVVSNHRAYEEAKHIPSSFPGQLPVTLLISTRKTSVGLVQKEIDRAPETGLIIKRWNVIDVTERCLPERHKPEEPRVKLYINDSLLRHVPENDFNLLDDAAKKQYRETSGFAGCVNCKLYAACQTRLATHQKSNSWMLKKIDWVIKRFGEVTIEDAEAQLLCRKPGKLGSVYPRFEPTRHCIDANQMASMVTGEVCQGYDKEALIQLFISRGARIVSGLDHGFSHNFAVVTGAVWGSLLYIFDVISVAGLDPEEKVQICERIKVWEPEIWPDTESPSDNKLFRKRGYRIRDWNKGQGSVKNGINIVRMKMAPIQGIPQMYLLAGDHGCELLAKRITSYGFVIGADGEPTEIPSEKDDDEMDAMRYLVMNVFAGVGQIVVAQDIPNGVGQAPKVQVDPNEYIPGQQPTVSNYLNYYINSALGGAPDVRPGKSIPDGKSKGRVFYDFT